MWNFYLYIDIIPHIIYDELLMILMDGYMFIMTPLFNPAELFSPTKHIDRNEYFFKKWKE